MRSFLLVVLTFTACTGDGADTSDTVADTDSDSDADTDSDSDADSDSDSDADSDADADVDASTSFFVTSSGTGANGGNFGGLTGADARCQSLATTVALGDKTWHAYLSSSTVNARDRIGVGPWFDVNGVQVAANLTALHAAGIPSSSILDENGAAIPREEHDIVTGSNPDGTAYVYGSPYTCFDWSTSAGDIYTWVGHADWSSDENPTDNWNSQHGTPCSQDGMATTLCAGRTYCFAL